MVFMLSVIKDPSVKLLMDAGFSYFKKCVLSISLSIRPFTCCGEKL